MSLGVTLGVLAAAAVLLAAASLGARRPREPGELPLVPYGAIQFLAMVAIVLMLAHLVTLLTGHPLVGRLGR
jgi:hypothetical protein